MSRSPFDPSEVDGSLDPRDPAVEELERYATIASDQAPGNLADRVMSAVAAEPTPRRGLMAWLVTPPSAGRPFARFARVTVLGATLVLAVAGALYAGELARLVRDFSVGSTPQPSPSITESFEPSPSQSVSPSPSISPVESESESPEQSGAPGSSAPTATPRSSTSQPSPTGSEDESKSPSPSQTPDETDIPEPTSTST
ncbi:MAG TPA: hypothetical protein VIH00_11685 [Candidatus Limnocylindrales bacterium]